MQKSFFLKDHFKCGYGYKRSFQVQIQMTKGHFENKFSNADTDKIFLFQL